MASVVGDGGSGVVVVVGVVIVGVVVVDVVYVFGIPSC